MDCLELNKPARYLKSVAYKQEWYWFEDTIFKQRETYL